LSPAREPTRVSAEALDWVALHNSPPAIRRAAYSYPPIDLLLVVDCIYHPSLLPALVDTIDYLATIERTVVLVVVELRAEDVVREFLELWLGTGGGDIWEIWHLQDVMEGPYAVWLGWKKTTIT
jgi:protein N-lysine methyltransferase METTL21D